FDQFKNDFADPDFLAVVARGLLNDLDQVSHEDHTALRQQRVILDGLANLCVGEGRGQAVAIAAALLPGGTSIYVAQNGPVSSAVLEHLRHLLQRLKAVSGRAGPPTHLFFEKPQSASEHALVNLEDAILEFAWPKLLQRLTKNQRDVNFNTVVLDVCGIAAEQRDLPPLQRDALAKLQASPCLDQKTLREIGVDLRNIKTILDTDPATRKKLYFLALRALLESVHCFYQSVANHGEVFGIWNKFLEYRTLHPDLESPSTVVQEPAEKEPTVTVKKEPDTLRWLQKLTSIRHHTLHVARLATAPRLVPLLHNVEIIPINNQVNPKTIKMNEETLHDVLIASNCEISQGAGEKNVKAYLETLARAAAATEKPDKEFHFRNPRPVHCECALLAALHDLPAIPYIGVSKRSCGFCRLYFDAYGAVTGSIITTLGSHGRATAWRAPTIADPEINEQIRLRLATQLKARMKLGWNRLNRSSLNLQSTSASGETDSESRQEIKRSKGKYVEELRELSLNEYPTD
ncbi:hypothetical protein DFH06DRAFT_1219764, partial [Mycena polygramma]